MKNLKIEDLTMKTPDQTYAPFIEQPEAPTDEISLKAITELFDPKKLKINSRVKFEQVQVISKLYLFADTFKENYTKRLADLVLQLQISTSGLGRREIVQLVQQRSTMIEIPNQTIKSKDIFR